MLQTNSLRTLRGEQPPNAVVYRAASLQRTIRWPQKKQIRSCNWSEYDMKKTELTLFCCKQIAGKVFFYNDTKVLEHILRCGSVLLRIMAKKSMN